MCQMTVSLVRPSSNYGWYMWLQSTVKLAIYIYSSYVACKSRLKVNQGNFWKIWVLSWQFHTLLRCQKMSWLDLGLKLRALPSVSASNYVPWIAHKNAERWKHQGPCNRICLLIYCGHRISDFFGSSFDICKFPVQTVFSFVILVLPW